MSAMGYRYSVVFLCCLWAAFLVAADSFTAELCPLSYLRYDTSNGYQLYATCSFGGGDSTEYRTSTLNLDQCLTNQNGALVPANSPSDKYPGGFSKTCWACGIHVQEAGPNWVYQVYLSCTCQLQVHEKMPGTPTYILDNVLLVNDGILQCTGDKGTACIGVEVTNPGDDHMPVLPTAKIVTTATPSSVTASTVTVTATGTLYQTVTNNSTATTTAVERKTVTETAIVTVVTTIVDTSMSTATTTATTTAITTESLDPITVTETHKKTQTKTSKVTETQSVTTTVSVTSPSTVLVTMSPTCPHTIFATITDSHFAVFTTIEQGARK
ncbi:hypothetical protein F5Y05DRAFT_407247 [Hypoxylon sp. FL0543]|nr:hypothetical protein F5Y05DRAFT_407247 [Hypoxylon sp. FL0543]